MPALITHWLFGQEAAARLEGAARVCVGAGGPGEDKLAGSRRIAFLLGCQGPDPYFFALTTTRMARLHRLGSAMHRVRVDRSLRCMWQAARALPEEQREVGSAFAAGQLAHYVLDAVAHPYIFARENDICSGDDALTDAHHEVHALIESDLDVYLLHQLRGVSAQEVLPARTLPQDSLAEQIGGTVLATCAADVFDTQIKPHDYHGALEDMRNVYRLIEPAGSMRWGHLGRLERHIRAHSALQALAHRDDVDEAARSMNLGHEPWIHPYLPLPDGSPRMSRKDFGQVFEHALDTFCHVLPAIVTSDDAPIKVNADYHGRPL